MDRQEQAKQTFIRAMRQLFPDNERVQKSANEAEQDSLHEIVNQMIMGIAYRPEYDALIPPLQAAMDALREVIPETNKSAEKIIMVLREALPPSIQQDGESPTDFYKRAIRETQEWTD